MEDIQHMTYKTQAADFKQTINQSQADPRSVAGCKKKNKECRNKLKPSLTFLWDKFQIKPDHPQFVHPHWREKIIGSKVWEV